MYFFIDIYMTNLNWEMNLYYVEFMCKVLLFTK